MCKLKYRAIVERLHNDEEKKGKEIVWGYLYYVYNSHVFLPYFYHLELRSFARCFSLSVSRCYHVCVCVCVMYTLLFMTNLKASFMHHLFGICFKWKADELRRKYFERSC